MSVMILRSSHRGRSVSVLVKKIESIWTVVDVNGHSPESFPKKVGNAVNKFNKQFVDVPTMSGDMVAAMQY